MNKIIKITDKEKVNRILNPNYAIDNYITKNHCENISFSIANLNGEHGNTKSEESDRIYFALEGKGKFIFENEKIELLEGECLFIPKNTLYNMIGEMKLILINTPAFGLNKEIKPN